MERTFTTHRVRRTESLDGIWDFRMEGFDTQYRLPVPAVWEQHPDFLAHRGHGTYTRRVCVSEAGNLRLVFKGVSHTADVYFDGELVAHHYNAFTPFSAVVRGVSAGEHELRVCVDNTFSEQSALHRPNDYYTYGGITRPVSMERLSDVYVQWVHVTPYCADGQWHARLSVRIANLSEAVHTAQLALSLAGKTLSADVAVAAGGGGDGAAFVEAADLRVLPRVFFPADFAFGGVLVQNAPDDDGGVVVVRFYHLADAVLALLVEIRVLHGFQPAATRVVLFPHEDAALVAQVKEALVVRVVAGADGVRVHVL